MTKWHVEELNKFSVHIWFRQSNLTFSGQHKKLMTVMLLLPQVPLEAVPARLRALRAERQRLQAGQLRSMSPGLQRPDR